MVLKLPNLWDEEQKVIPGAGRAENYWTRLHLLTASLSDSSSLAKFFCKCQYLTVLLIVDILGFVGHKVTVTTTQLCLCSEKTVIDEM